MENLFFVFVYNDYYCYERLKRIQCVYMAEWKVEKNLFCCFLLCARISHAQDICISNFDDERKMSLEVVLFLISIEFFFGRIIEHEVQHVEYFTKFLAKITSAFFWGVYMFRINCQFMTEQCFRIFVLNVILWSSIRSEKQRHLCDRIVFKHSEFQIFYNFQSKLFSWEKIAPQRNSKHWKKIVNSSTQRLNSEREKWIGKNKLRTTNGNKLIIHVKIAKNWIINEIQ